MVALCCTHSWVCIVWFSGQHCFWCKKNFWRALNMLSKWEEHPPPPKKKNNWGKRPKKNKKKKKSNESFSKWHAWASKIFFFWGVLRWTDKPMPIVVVVHYKTLLALAAQQQNKGKLFFSRLKSRKTSGNLNLVWWMGKLRFSTPSPQCNEYFPELYETKSLFDSFQTEGMLHLKCLSGFLHHIGKNRI